MTRPFSEPAPSVNFGKGSIQSCESVRRLQSRYPTLIADRSVPIPGADHFMLAASNEAKELLKNFLAPIVMPSIDQ
jgi:hypothetical protein